tara:strand:- start:386 stop:532 length:147 start_codon:yes stop_codon:yes gene_type:complete
MKYIVKFLSVNNKNQIYTIAPVVSINEARKIVKDLISMRLSAWIEESK